jgi:hypothetical protein
MLSGGKIFLVDFEEENLPDPGGFPYPNLAITKVYLPPGASDLRSLVLLI